MSIWREFRDFIMRGNVMDLAIAVILGLSFGAVVDAFTNGVLMNFIAALFGRPDFDSLVLNLRGTPIYYGRFLTSVVNFLIISASVFALVKGINTIARKKVLTDTTHGAESDHQLLVDIRDALTAPRERTA